MAGELNTFDDEGVRRIVSVVRRIERQVQNLESAQLQPSARVVSPDPLQWVKVTSGTTTTVNGFAQYPAAVSTLDSLTGAFTDGTDTTWLVDTAGNTLTVGHRYQAKLTWLNTDGSPVFFVDSKSFTPPGASIEVKESDGSPDVTGVSVINLDQNSGISISGSGSGAVTIALIAATAAQVGVVNTAPQTWAGRKTFNGGVTSGADVNVTTGSVQVGSHGQLTSFAGAPGSSTNVASMVCDGSGFAQFSNGNPSAQVLAFILDCATGRAKLFSGTTCFFAINGSDGITDTLQDGTQITGGIVTQKGTSGLPMGGDISGTTISATIAPGAITAGKIAGGAVGTAALATDSVTATAIAAGAVGSSELAANAVVTAAITDLNVTTAKLADVAVTTAKIADVAVTTAKIADAAVTPAKLLITPYIGCNLK